MKVVIIQSNYIPWKGYFDQIALSDIFVVYDSVQYTKNDWRNRNIIKTSAGPQWLTIPVRLKSLHQSIAETEVDSGKWAGKHWKTLVQCYGKAPHFARYRSVFEELYLRSADEKLLSKVNVMFVKAICDILQIKTRVIDSSDIPVDGIKTERLLGICKFLNADTYVSGPAAKAYLDEKHMNESGVGVTWMDYGGYREYPQMYLPFTHQVSILDLIFNVGVEARNYMKH